MKASGYRGIGIASRSRLFWHSFSRWISITIHSWPRSYRRTNDFGGMCGTGS